MRRLRNGMSRSLGRVAAAVACSAIFAVSCPPAGAQSLPPLPKTAAAAMAKGAPPGRPPSVQEASAAAPQAAPLLKPGPTDLPKAKEACSALPEAGQEWMSGAFGALQAQTLRPGGLPRAKDAFAEVWLFFKAARSLGYDMDPHSGKIDAIYRALYPAGPFSPETPFERFKEPRRACPKKPLF
jgi:hypothetical protein